MNKIEKTMYKFLGVGFLILVIGMVSSLLAPVKYSTVILVTVLILAIICCLFLIITFIIYYKRRNKKAEKKFVSKNYLNELSNVVDNFYVCKKPCNEGVIYIFQYCNEEKQLIAVRTSNVEIKEIDNSRPYVEKKEEIYVPTKKDFIDKLYYDEKDEEKYRIRYILYINKDMIFSDL